MDRDGGGGLDDDEEDVDDVEGGELYDNAPAAHDAKRQKTTTTTAQPLRAIIHLDVNCMYAAVECARLYPQLEGKPVAVAQRTLLVTTNYVARDRGVPKMCSVIEGKRICPDLVVIESDMARYRNASRALIAVLSEFTRDVEKVSHARDTS